MISKNIEKKYWNMQNDLQNKMDSGNLGNLTVDNFRSVCAIGKELLKKHVASTFVKNVAEYFQSFGFLVTQDFDGVNYVIVEV